MSAPVPDFTLAGYQRLIATLAAKGYRCVLYPDGDPAARHLILRHDIDMDPEAAVRVAELENRVGVVATYFVLVRSELYNPASKAGTRAVHRLIELGHEVGLHFDATLYENDLRVLAQGAESERRVLEMTTGQAIRTLSLHRPSPALLDGEFAVPGLLNAYEPRFFEEFAYVSDSRGGWHHGHPLDHPAIAEGRGLHLLTHPIWWTEEGASAQNKLESFLARRYQRLELDLAANCSAFTPRGSPPRGTE